MINSYLLKLEKINFYGAPAARLSVTTPRRYYGKVCT
jgi:hypothetical protein